MAKNKRDNIDSFSGMFGGQELPSDQIIRSEPVIKGKGRPKEIRETKQRKNFSLFPSIYDNAQKIAFVERKSLSDVVGRFLEMYVEENQDKLAEYDKINK